MSLFWNSNFSNIYQNILQQQQHSLLKFRHYNCNYFQTVSNEQVASLEAEKSSLKAENSSLKSELEKVQQVSTYDEIGLDYIVWYTSKAWDTLNAINQTKRKWVVAIC